MGTQHAGFTPSTDSPLQDDLIGSNAADLLARKYDLKAGQSIKRGTVVGIDGSSDILTSLSGASDGSQTPFGVAAVDADNVSNSPPDTEILIFTRGSFNEHALILGSAHTVASIREGLRDKGIYLETPVKRYP